MALAIVFEDYTEYFDLRSAGESGKSDVRHPWDMTQIDLFVVSYIENDIFAYRLLFCGTELLLK